jgi:hypothetical protein
MHSCSAFLGYSKANANRSNKSGDFRRPLSNERGDARKFE